MLLANIEKFLEGIRFNANEARKLANIEPFKSSGPKFSDNGVSPSQNICTSEASTYKHLANEILYRIEADIKQHDVKASEQFRHHVINAYEYNNADFNNYNRSDIRDYFKFIPRTAEDIIAQYYVNGSSHRLIQALLQFRPIYTDMLLNDAIQLRHRVSAIKKMFTLDNDIVETDVLELNYYFNQLIGLAFQSNDSTEATNYIERLAKNYGPLLHRVLPPGYIEPEASVPIQTAIQVSPPRLTYRPDGVVYPPTVQTIVYGNLKQVNSNRSYSGMASHNENKNGPGVQNINGSGAQNTGFGNQNVGSGTQSSTTVLKNESSGSGHLASAVGPKCWVAIVVIAAAVGIYAMRESDPQSPIKSWVRLTGNIFMGK
jgi:hypothetical protein